MTIQLPETIKNLVNGAVVGTDKFSEASFVCCGGKNADAVRVALEVASNMSADVSRAAERAAAKALSGVLR
jgi:hypothetical protein